MKGYKIRFEGVSMQEAMAQIELIQEIDQQQRNRLMLLTEEMFSMLENVLSNREADFEIKRTENAFSLGISTQAAVSESARMEYMSMSTDGRNLAHKGIKGKILGLFEGMAKQGVWGSGGAATDFGFTTNYGDYSYLWCMSQYYNSLSEAEKESAWDGLEKSIIASYADDVLVGVRDDRVEMIVRKEFK